MNLGFQKQKPQCFSDFNVVPKVNPSNLNPIDYNFEIPIQVYGDGVVNFFSLLLFILVVSQIIWGKP